MRRVLQNIAITAGALVIFYWTIRQYDTALRDPRFFDGWILCAGMGLQLLFSLRKKLPALPLGRAAVWMQVHTYLGFFVIGAFAVHTGFSTPDTLFEWALWSFFVVVALSGVIGRYLTLAIPAKLEGASTPVVFERIPAYRSDLASEVDLLAKNSVNQAGLRTISDFYVTTLHGFFNRPQNFLAHLKSSRRPLKHICDEIEALDRYLDEPGRETLQSIQKIVIAKDDLDSQYAHQWLLKAWLFVHVPATYGLIVLTLLHVVVIYSFSSGVP